MSRKIVVTSALPYANGPIHIGHLVEYLQTDIWVRFHKMCGNQCLYFCADDTHGTPVMISARAAGISPEELIEQVHKEHKADFKGFYIEFDNYYTTHSDENRLFSERIFNSLNQAGSIVKRNVEQAYCEKCGMWLPDRYIRGSCPRCKAEDQYGDSCEACSSTYRPTELINPKCATCGTEPVHRKSQHYFIKLADYEQQLKQLIAKGYVQKSAARKLDEWFKAGLKDWDISRDGPYFGFKIPGEKNKFFYVWLDAPIGYMASAQNYCDKYNLDFDKVWNSSEYELYHFIGKDIMYFHALYWPAMLMEAGFKTAKQIFIHGFLTINGQKMSKSRGTFIEANTYIKYLDPEYLRYYYASKLTGGIEDIDLRTEDFVNKTNSDLVGKLANLASRSGPMLTKKLDSRLSQLDEKGGQLINKLTVAKDRIIRDYEGLNYASVVRTIIALADEANRYVEQNQPWVTVKTDLERTQTTLTAVINAVRILTIYLKPILPKYAEKVEKFLNVDKLSFADVETVLANHRINDFERLVERIDTKQVNAMIEESKEGPRLAGTQAQSSEPMAAAPVEPIKPECTIEDFAKIDLRIAKVVKAEAVEGADKLLRLDLDVGGLRRSVLAAIARMYKPDELTGKTVVYLANLKPRKMRFGLSEGMILAADAGGNDVFVLSVDVGARPGQKVL
ncbi:MAG: methionine--tRNA ligase [Planctomycetota bacterium]|jgi:methionyl-tRNA synthetase